MEIRHLKSFVVVAEELHFGRAASRLNIAQPAVTAQIQSIEREMGVQLFTRSTRRVELTEAGSVFYEQSLQIMRAVDRGVSLTQSVAGRDLKQITIGTIYPATFGVLPEFLSRISDRYPNVKIHIHNGTTDAIVREIEHGRINIGFVRAIENFGSLRWQAIARERYLLALASNNPLCERANLCLDDLRHESIITFSRSNRSYTDQYFLLKLKEHGLEGRIRFTCNDSLAIAALVSAGVGVGFVPEWVANSPDRSFQLRPVDGVDLNIELGLAWSADDPTANRDHIIELARQLISSGG